MAIYRKSIAPHSLTQIAVLWVKKRKEGLKLVSRVLQYKSREYTPSVYVCVTVYVVSHRRIVQVRAITMARSFVERRR